MAYEADDDTNKDGCIDAEDAFNTYEYYIANNGCTTPPCSNQYDTNSDSIINVLDFLSVINKICTEGDPYP